MKTFETFEKEVCDLLNFQTKTGVATDTFKERVSYKRHVSNDNHSDIQLSIYRYDNCMEADIYKKSKDLWLILNVSDTGEYCLQENLINGDIIYLVDGAYNFRPVKEKLTGLFNL